MRDALVPLPRAVADVMAYHQSGKTVTIGGERGTVAWVDLWRGVILCYVLDDDRPVLRDVPLPVPARGNWDRILRDGDPWLRPGRHRRPEQGLYQVRRDGIPAIDDDRRP